MTRWFRRATWCACVPLLLFAVTGCASTKIVDTWRDPEFQGPINFRRTLVVAMHPDPTLRKVAENTIVERIGRTRAIAGSQLLTEEERHSRAKLNYRLTKGDVDGVITIAIVGTRQLVGRADDVANDEPFYTYYDRAAAFTAGPTAAETETAYRVETRIYALKPGAGGGGKLIWTAVSDTVDPENAHDAVQDIAKAVGGELRKQKLIR
jgi:hypothetical protein